ncbi:GNAT family N-acetyltransferase [Streptomyces spiralis]|uniref:GNAT family N-acetyltransferase n=1 Tax=Streptomyces spiralis TaxID=66376 RepID=UPI00340F72DC
MKKAVFMVNGARAIGTPHDDRTQALKDAQDPGLMASVFANFRQYLMGWDAESRPGPVVDQFRSGLATPQFNGVVRVRSASELESAVAAVRRDLAGLPWWWWVGPDSAEDTADALQRHGGRQLAVLPVLVRSLGQPADPAETLDPAGSAGTSAGLRMETVRDGERLAELVRTYRTSMGIAPGLEAEMVRIESRREDNADIIRLAAVLDGRVVGSTVVITAHGVAGIFLVHVAEAHRRRGIGAALTVAALRAGQESGMRSAALVASPAGEPLYRRFGFTTLSEYRLFAFPV